MVRGFVVAAALCREELVVAVVVFLLVVLFLRPGEGTGVFYHPPKHQDDEGDCADDEDEVQRVRNPGPLPRRSPVEDVCC